MAENTQELIDMARAAMRDERLSDGALYGKLADKIARLSGVNADMLKVLDAARIVLKNRDQRPNEMKLLDAIKIVIVQAEAA
jgi:hypothetical protein